jgi:hypothetical protein
MVHAMFMQVVFITVFFLVPGVIGGWIAYTKGRNPIIWFLLNTLFPPTLMVTIFQNPARPVEGHYRKCPKCGRYSKWRETTCRFCDSELT